MDQRSNPAETRVRGCLSNVGEEAHQPSITILKEPAVRLQKDTIERNAKNFEVSRRRYYPVKVSCTHVCPITASVIRFQDTEKIQKNTRLKLWV